MVDENLFINYEQFKRINNDYMERMKNVTGLLKSLEVFFSLPNWENRIGPWKDVNEGLKEVFETYKKVVGERE